jgi:hypothetical protein
MSIKFHTMVVGVRTPIPKRTAGNFARGGTQRFIEERVIPNLEMCPDGAGVEVRDINKLTWQILETRFPHLLFQYEYTHRVWSDAANDFAGGWVDRHKVHISKRVDTRALVRDALANAEVPQ